MFINAYASSKPNSVEGDNLSRVYVAIHFKRATKFALAPNRVYRRIPIAREGML